MGFALLVLRVVEGEHSAWKPVQFLYQIGGFNKLFSSFYLQTLAMMLGNTDLELWDVFQLSFKPYDLTM